MAWYIFVRALHPMEINVSGKTIRIENTQQIDVDAIVQIEKANSAYIGQNDHASYNALLTDGNCLHLSIWSAEDNRLVGHILLFGVENTNKVLEFKRIAISEKGKGFGREAVDLVKKLCFEQLGFHRLWLDVFDDNERAWKLYESEGFVQEGLLRENIKTDKGYRSLRIYSMLEQEYYSTPKNEC